MWVCVYCGSKVSKEPDSMCCGEVGHSEWYEPKPGDDCYDGEEVNNEKPE